MCLQVYHLFKTVNVCPLQRECSTPSWKPFVKKATSRVCKRSSTNTMVIHSIYLPPSPTLTSLHALSFMISWHTFVTSQKSTRRMWRLFTQPKDILFDAILWPHAPGHCLTWRNGADDTHIRHNQCCLVGYDVTTVIIVQLSVVTVIHSRSSLPSSVLADAAARFWASRNGIEYTTVEVTTHSTTTHAPVPTTTTAAVTYPPGDSEHTSRF